MLLFYTIACKETDNRRFHAFGQTFQSDLPRPGPPKSDLPKHRFLSLRNIALILKREQDICQDRDNTGCRNRIIEDELQCRRKLCDSLRVSGYAHAECESQSHHENISLAEACFGDHLDPVDQDHAEYGNDRSAEHRVGDG